MEAKKKHVLTKSKIFLSKSDKRGTAHRDGFVDEDGQVYLPPVGAHNLKLWQDEMTGCGHSFKGN